MGASLGKLKKTVLLNRNQVERDEVDRQSDDIGGGDCSGMPGVGLRSEGDGPTTIGTSGIH